MNFSFTVFQWGPFTTECNTFRDFITGSNNAGSQETFQSACAAFQSAAPCYQSFYPNLDANDPSNADALAAFSGFDFDSIQQTCANSQ